MKTIDMQEACSLLGIDYEPRGTQANIACPMCQSNKRKTLNINFANNVFSCPKCNESGGVLDFWALMKGFSSRKEAARDIQKTLHQNSCTSNNFKNVQHPKITIMQENPLAAIEVRDKTYNELLSQLNLRENHRKDLRSRGLTDLQIEALGYKSMPLTGLHGIAKTLLTNGSVLEGVPGFYKNKAGLWELVAYSDGYLIPVRNGKEQIQGFQIRLDNSSNSKYIFLSSVDKNHGTRSRSYCHFVRGDTLNEIILTEGALKADIINAFCGKSVLAILGVNATSHLESALYSLKRKGLKRVYIGFDMDYKTNPNVQAALQKIKGILEKTELEYWQLIWNDSFKGLDDYLKSKRK